MLSLGDRLPPLVGPSTSSSVLSISLVEDVGSCSVVDCVGAVVVVVVVVVAAVVVAGEDVVRVELVPVPLALPVGDVAVVADDDDVDVDGRLRLQLKPSPTKPGLH